MITDHYNRSIQLQTTGLSQLLLQLTDGVEEDEYKVHMVRHPHDAVLHIERVLQVEQGQ